MATTSLAYITEHIQPTAEPAVYNDNAAALAALNAKQIDGLVVDLGTAFYMVAAELENGVIVGTAPRLSARASTSRCCSPRTAR